MKIADGDTITVLTPSKKQIKIRLYGVDTPEKKQDFGQKAKQFTIGLVAGKQVDVETIDTDRYGRTVGIVSVGKVCLNVELLKNGYAWQYGAYCKKSFCGDWKKFETTARNRKIGLWSNPHAQAPWDFRRGVKKGHTQSKKNDVSDGKYHGNIKSHKFHRPGCKHYNCRNCNVIFNSREDAINLGYTGCGLCKP